MLEAQFAETVEVEPELLAHHYTEAGCIAQAVGYWQQAGHSAIQRSAHVEAIRHLRQGFALLQTLPETPERIQREVDMHIALVASLSATQGPAAPEVEQAYLHAHHLCAHLEEPQRLFPVLRGLCLYYNVRAEFQTARALAEQLLRLAQHTQDTGMLAAAHQGLGTTLFFMGAGAAAHTHFARGIALDDPQPHHTSVYLYGQDAGVVCRSHAARVLWSLGAPDQGLTQNQEAVRLAQQVAHPFSLSVVLGFAAVFHQLRREVRGTQEHADATIRLATEQGFSSWMAFGTMLHGWALAHQGRAQEGITQLTQGLRDYRATGAETNRPYFLALLAEAQGTHGAPEAGLAMLKEALTLVEKTGERWYAPELYRLQGALLVQQTSDNHPEAASYFHHALEIARNQQAKSFELRTATSLAHLWQQQGKRREAHELLASVYGWFTEGFETADLQEARTLLGELER